MLVMHLNFEKHFMNQTKCIYKSYATSQAPVCLLEDFFFFYSAGNKQKMPLPFSLHPTTLFPDSSDEPSAPFHTLILVLPPEFSLCFSNYMHQDGSFILLWFLRISICQWFPYLRRLTWASFLSFKTILLILNTWVPLNSHQLRWN